MSVSDFFLPYFTPASPIFSELNLDPMFLHFTKPLSLVYLSTNSFLYGCHHSCQHMPLMLRAKLVYYFMSYSFYTCPPFLYKTQINAAPEYCRHMWGGALSFLFLVGFNERLSGCAVIPFFPQIWHLLITELLLYLFFVVIIMVPILRISLR